jgi:pimeloyl-ACP methyl ester carboxylesterase
VLIPSLGRGVDDFTQLAGALAGGGMRAIAIDPRGIGSSTGPLDDLTLHDYAADVAAVIEARAEDAVDVVGHAFGNRVARCLATDRPDLVRRVVLIAAGGSRPIDPDVRATLARCFDTQLPQKDRMQSVADAFFAPGHDASVWRSGWFPEAAVAQSRAAERTAVEEWLDAGGAEVLVVQGSADPIAPPDVGRSLVDRLDGRARLIEVEAGHALLPEQPDAIATAVLGFLSEALM